MMLSRRRLPEALLASTLALSLVLPAQLAVAQSAAKPDVITIYELNDNLKKAPSWGLAPSACSYSSSIDLGERQYATTAPTGTACGAPRSGKIRQDAAQVATDAQSLNELIKRLPPEEQDDAAAALKKFNAHQCGGSTKKKKGTLADCMKDTDASKLKTDFTALKAQYDDPNNHAFKDSVDRAAVATINGKAQTDAQQIFDDSKAQLKSVLNAQMDELSRSFLHDPTNKDSRPFVEEAFKRLSDAVDAVQPDFTSGGDLCVKGQHATLFVRGKDGKNKVVVCPATLQADSTAELASAFTRALARAVDSCALDRMTMGKPAPGVPMSGLFEPLRVCLATKAAKTKDDRNKILPDLTPPFNATQKAAYDDKLGRVKSTFATQAPEAPHCPAPITASSAAGGDPNVGKRRDSSIELMANYLGDLALKRYKDTKCGATTDAKGLEKLENKADGGARAAADATIKGTSGCDGTEKAGFSALLGDAAYQNFTFSPDNTKVVAAPAQQSAPPGGEGQPPLRQQAAVAPPPSQQQPPGNQPPPPPPGRGVLTSYDENPELAGKLGERQAAIYGALGSARSECHDSLNQQTFPFDKAEQQCSSSGSNRVDLEFWDPPHGIPTTPSPGTYQVKVGCRAHYSCTEHNAYYPEPTYVGMAVPPPPAPSYNKTTVAADIRFYFDKDETHGRYGLAAKACYRNAPAASGGEVTAACGDPNHTVQSSTGLIKVPVSSDRSTMSFLGETSGAIVTFGCNFYCSCGTPKRCEVQETPPKAVGANGLPVLTDADLSGSNPGIKEGAPGDKSAITSGTAPATPGVNYLAAAAAKVSAPAAGNNNASGAAGAVGAGAASGAAGGNSLAVRVGQGGGGAVSAQDVAITDHYKPGSATPNDNLASFNDKYLTMFTDAAGPSGQCAKMLTSQAGGRSDYCNADAVKGKSFMLPAARALDGSLTTQFGCACDRNGPKVWLAGVNPPTDQIANQDSPDGREAGRVADWDSYQRTHPGEINQVCNNLISMSASAADPFRYNADYQSFFNGMRQTCGSDTGKMTFVNPTARFTRDNGLLTGAPLPYQCQLSCDCAHVAALKAAADASPNTPVARLVTPANAMCSSSVPVLGKNVPVDLRNVAVTGAGSNPRGAHDATADEDRVFHAVAQQTCDQTKSRILVARAACGADKPIRWPVYVPGLDASVRFNCQATCPCGVDAKTKQPTTTCGIPDLSNSAVTAAAPVPASQRVAAQAKPPVVPAGTQGAPPVVPPGTQGVPPVAPPGTQGAPRVDQLPPNPYDTPPAGKGQAQNPPVVPPVAPPGNKGQAQNPPVVPPVAPPVDKGQAQNPPPVATPGGTQVAVASGGRNPTADPKADPKAQPDPKAQAAPPTAEPKADSSVQPTVGAASPVAGIGEPKISTQATRTPLGKATQFTYRAPMDLTKTDDTSKAVKKQVKDDCAANVGKNKRKISKDSIAAAKAFCQKSAGSSDTSLSAPPMFTTPEMNFDLDLNVQFEFQCGFSCQCPSVLGKKFDPSSCNARTAEDDSPYKITMVASCDTHAEAFASSPGGPAVAKSCTRKGDTYNYTDRSGCKFGCTCGYDINSENESMALCFPTK